MGKNERFAQKPKTTPSQVPLNNNNTLGNSWLFGQNTVLDDRLTGKCASKEDELKDQDDFRINFLRKLAYSKVWVPQAQRPPKHQTVIIFDWDDTVLPSTWVQCQGLRLDEGSEVSAWQREQLLEVAKVAIATLRLAKQHGTVVLVTNAERGWIELSCQKFMPTLFPSLENVKVVSARTSYESAETSSPLDWKLRAFEAEIRRCYGSTTLVDPDSRKNVLSLGDSVHEREALLRASSPLPNCRSKSLKFVERPDIAQICKQHSLVTSCFDRIVHHDGNLDLCIRCA